MGEETTPPDMAQWSDQLSAAWEQYRTRLFEGQRHVSDWLIDRVDPQPGQVILELAAGPGETGFLAAQRVGAEGKVVSTDMNPGMVDAARRGPRRGASTTWSAGPWTPRRSTWPTTPWTGSCAASA